MKERSYLTLDPQDLPQPLLHSYLLSAVAPRPIAFASTIDQSGKVNLSPFSFFNVFSSNPPILIFSPANRGTDNSTKHTLENVLEVPEVVINIVNHPIVEQMSLSSTNYKKGVNEFKKAGLTELTSDLVQPPRVAESPVALECTVDNVISLGDHGGAGNLVISRVVKMHIDKAYLRDDQKIDTQKMDLVARMGGAWYTRASGDALFQIPKPLSTLGIGVDALPSQIRKSMILTGNDLGRLGNLESLPSQEAIESAKAKHKVHVGLNNEEIHSLAKNLIERNETKEALAIMME